MSDQIIFLGGGGGFTNAQSTSVSASISSGFSAATSQSALISDCSSQNTSQSKLISTTSSQATIITAPRIETLTDATPVAPNTDNFEGGLLTTLSQTTDFLNPTGTPSNGRTYTLRIKSSTVRSLTWTNGGAGTQYRGSADLALPTTTSGASLTDYLVFRWNSADSKWDLVGRNFGF